MKIDELQYETGEGPCLSSIKEHATFVIADMDDDETWPKFSARAARETGVRSMLSHVLEVEQDALGALNLTALEKDAFTSEDVATGAIFAVHAGIALGNALTFAQEENQIIQLEEGLVTRKVIGQATGLLMAQEGLSADEAFERLVHVSQNANVKLRDIARRYVDAWEAKGP